MNRSKTRLEIASEYGISRRTLQRWLKKEKIEVTKGLVTPVDIANQVTTIMTTDALEHQLSLADFVIVPLGNDLTSIDFELSDSLIALGY